MNQEIIKRRLLEQEEYAKTTLEKNLIERDKFKEFQKYLKSKQIKAIIGPRRAGKTTISLQLLKNKKFYYINFDDEVLVTIKQEELGKLIEQLNEIFGHRDYIFLDEIQNIDSWELFVNRLQRMGYNIIISGSNSNLLSKELSSHLGGRTFILEILPFSFKEYLKAKKYDPEEFTDQEIGLIKNKLKNYISIGGFPDAIINIHDTIVRDNYYKEIFNTIIFRDIMQRFKIRHTTELVALTNIIMNQYSLRTSLTKISKELDISVHTITKYLSYLEEGYIILGSKKFSYKPREIESSFKKYYVIDTGLIHSKRITTTNDFGKLIENIVALELKRKGVELFYYLAENKYETDFVVRENNKISEVIQVVYDKKEIPEREIKTGLLTCSKLKCKKLTIITWNKEGQQKEKGIDIKFIPLWKFLIS